MDDNGILFKELFGTNDDIHQFHCPGRVNLIGEHIDYLGGLVMPAAISLGLTATVRMNNSHSIGIHSTDFNETCAFDLRSLPSVRQNHWTDFIVGVLLNLRQQGIEPSGCDLLIESDLPKGTGLSSSAALEVLCYYMFHSMFTGGEPDRVKMAVECQKIENGFVGLNCGIMDQFAVANGRSDHAIVLNCGSLEYELTPLNLKNNSLLIINSNKPRTLAESAYNERRQQCDNALKLIAQARPIHQLVDATESDLDLIADPVLKRRARHAFSEQTRVERSADALRNGDLNTFGKWMNESHTSLRDDFEVSCPELDFIVNEFRKNPSCLGVRMTGAGFGGCCIALVATNAVGAMTEQLERSYTLRFGFAPTFHECKTSDGVHRVTA